jgi:hypothetical protein
LDIVLLLFKQHTNLDKGISLPLERECAGEDGVLEVADSLLNLVSLGKDHSQLVKYFTLLVEVWRHLENSD